jgi:hypothetical protein
MSCSCRPITQQWNHGSTLAASAFFRSLLDAIRDRTKDFARFDEATFERIIAARQSTSLGQRQLYRSAGHGHGAPTLQLWLLLQQKASGRRPYLRGEN